MFSAVLDSSDEEDPPRATSRSPKLVNAACSDATAAQRVTDAALDAELHQLSSEYAFAGQLVLMQLKEPVQV